MKQDIASFNKTVSVAMTTFNGERFLEEQLLSILAQTLPPTEIIVCDDGSTDSTVNILRDYANRYPQIRYFVNAERMGVVRNFKKAVSLTKCDYIALSDQDDYWLPQKLAVLVERLTSTDARLPCIAYSDMALTDEQGNTRNPSFWNELGQDGYRHCFETLVFGNFVTGCTVLMNRTMRDHFIQMPPDVMMHDAWLSLIAFSIGSAVTVSQPLVKYRSHAANVVFSKDAYRKKSKLQRILAHCINLFSKNDFIIKELKSVAMFREQYGHLLTPKQAKQTEAFLRLRNKSYFYKMAVFRITFRKHWLR